MSDKVSRQARASRNLLCHAMNRLIEFDVLSRRSRAPKEIKAIKTDVLGRPSVIMYQDAGNREVRLSVWWDFVSYLIARKASPNRAGIQAHTAKRYLQ